MTGRRRGSDVLGTPTGRARTAAETPALVEADAWVGWMGWLRSGTGGREETCLAPGHACGKQFEKTVALRL